MSTPHALAERRGELNRTIDSLEREIDEAESSLRDLRATVLELMAERRGMDAAITAYDSLPPATVSAKNAPRRDIKALVQAELAALPVHPGMNHDEKVRYLCKQLRYARSTIEAALRAIDKPGNTGDALGQITSKEEQDARYAYPSLTGGLSP